MRQDNRIVHGLWIGPLSRLERLTLHSFVEHSHEFHLWRYEETCEHLPAGVVVRDASEILPRRSVFRKRADDPRQELGAGSYATFSDLFRAKLLHEVGGIWVDMDVVCLRPFDFATPYVFRGHALGSVMNLIKCPAGSPLMRGLVERMTARTDEGSGWFDFTLAFIKGIAEHDLQGFVRSDLMPEDRWESIQPFLQGDAPFDPAWYGLHWMNELWRKLKASGGVYMGQPLARRLPDRNHPIPGSRLFRLYERHGLLRGGWSPVPPPRIPVRQLSPRQASPAPLSRPADFNVVIASLNLGGAERIAVDTLQHLREAGVNSRLFVLHEVQPSFDVDGLAGCDIQRLHERPYSERLPAVATALQALATPLVFAHLVRVRDLESLGRAGVQVVPVVHNEAAGWLDRPQAFDQRWIPFVVAVSENVKAQLVSEGCQRPVVVIRHELQRPPPTPAAAAAARRAVRRRHGVPDEALLIGMVGQFKAQKAYTRAVRVLAEVQRRTPARLMILGGWDHPWGSGRAAYTAMCRQAIELGVMADIIAPGPVQPVEPYYCAFDVLLNTSVFEGLSVAILEAKANGCPIVSANVGGHGDIKGEADRLLAEPFDVQNCAEAVLDAAAPGDRRLPAPEPEADLIPRLWTLLGRHGGPRTRRVPGRPPTLVLTENLNIGGPQRSLTNLLRHMPDASDFVVASLAPAHCPDFLDELEAAGVRVVAIEPCASTLRRADQVLHLLEREGAQTLVFWNVPAPLKLALAKVLEVRPIRIVDVSPGPMLRRELLASEGFGRRLCLDAEAYFRRLNAFVAKHTDGVPPELAGSRTTEIHIVPNGVPSRAGGGASADPEGPPVIGACCRITPAKKLDLLVDVMDALVERIPNVRLTVIGAADPWHEGYAAQIADKIARAGLGTIRFVDPGANVRPHLQDFHALVMLSDEQGCPNASLEAMAAGVPVAANHSGGVAEQVLDGVTGLIVPDDDAPAIALAVERLLRDAGLRERLSSAARQYVAQTFSMDRMIAGYRDAFAPTRAEPKAVCA